MNRVYRHEFCEGATIVSMEEELRRQNWRRQRQKCLSCCKSFTAFLFSHIGLSALVVAYSIMGGFLFGVIEADKEKEDRRLIILERDTTIKRLYDTAVLLKVQNISNTTLMEIFRDVIGNYTEEVTVAVKEKGWDGKDNDEELQWSFAGALLYAITVITTIGKFESSNNF